MNKYYYTDGKEQFGPFSKYELQKKVLHQNTKIWRPGLEKWTAIKEVEEFKTIYNLPHKKEPFHTIEQNSHKKNKTLWIIPVLLVFIMTLLYIGKYNEDETSIESIRNSAYNTDVDFNMYVNKFYRDLNFYGIYPPKPKVKIIKFSDFDKMKDKTHIHGMSLGNDDDEKIEIYINPSSWKKFNKPMKYWLMYHELSHDVLNVDDLKATEENKGKLMYPELSDYEHKNMDDFIESFKKLFEEQTEK